MSIVVERRRSGARIAPLWKNRDYLRWFTGICSATWAPP